MKDNGQAMVLASFLADTLALGVHWIYDTKRIEEEFGRVDTLLNPGPDSYHPTKVRGEFTHYGDQAFVLLESLANKKAFDLEDFSMRWRDLFKNYEGYYDGATKLTLENLSRGIRHEDAGSPSKDLAGASRIAPLVFCYREDLDTLVNAAKIETRMTHNTPSVMESAEFFARVSWMVLKGMSPISALEHVAKERFEESPIFQWVKEGMASKSMESVQVISRFGQSCHTEEAFPGVVQLISRYEDNLEEALIQSVMAGGDSAGRGMLVGMVLGAHLGRESLPEKWISGLKREKEISRLLERLS